MRVLLVDDHALVRAGFRKLLEEGPGFEVVGEAECGNEALDAIRAVTPDVVLMDISMPNLNGIEATRRATKEFPGVKIVMLSMHADRFHVERSLARLHVDVAHQPWWEFITLGARRDAR